jgi:hypothetical protein
LRGPDGTSFGGLLPLGPLSPVVLRYALKNDREPTPLPAFAPKEFALEIAQALLGLQ